MPPDAETIDVQRTAQTARPVLIRSGPRRGVQTLEVILTLPVVVLTLVSGIQFGIVGVTKQTMQCAASSAANTAALGGQRTDIQQAADRALAVHDLQLGKGLLLIIEDYRGIRHQIGDRSVYPGSGSNRFRRLTRQEYRARLYVRREAGNIPKGIHFMGTDIQTNDLAAVATAMAH